MPKTTVLTIVLVATLDTKDIEVGFVKEQIEQRGQKTTLMDIGILGQPLCQAGITRQQIVQASGMDLQKAIDAGDRQKAVAIVKVLLPLRGWSEADKEGGPLYNPQADRAFDEEIKNRLKPQIQVVEVDAHLNDPPYAETAVALLEEIIGRNECPKP